MATTRGEWALRLTRNVLLWLAPVWVVWSFLLTPFYNRFLAVSAENLVRLTESPRATRLLRADEHYVTVSRTDFPPAKQNLYRVRVTDIHYHLLLVGGLFLGVPGVAWRRRLTNLGWAVLVAVFFHIVDLFFWVKFVYATQLGSWSAQHYGAFAQNFWGLGKHLFDMPFKLALPLALWLAVYFRELAPARD
jgi:hypothetical protein